MDILPRYGLSGYVLFLVLFLYAPQVHNFLVETAKSQSLGNVIFIVILGIPLGYLINQLTSFLYHIVPPLGLHYWKGKGKLVSKEARKEMEVYKAQLKKLEGSFDFKEWFAWRWTHLTINANIMVSVILALIIATVLNGVTENFWWPKYTLCWGRTICFILIVLVFIVLSYNYYLYRYFIMSMYEAINEINTSNNRNTADE